MKGTRVVVVLSVLSVFWSGCASRVEVRDTLESAREKTVVKWIAEGGAVRWATDLEGAFRTGVLQMRLERAEIPVYRVKDAVVRRETIIRPYEGPHQTEEEKRQGRDLLQVFGLILIPLMIAALPVIGVLMMTGNMPESHYGAPSSTITMVDLPEGEIRGGPASITWRGIPSVAVQTDNPAARFVTDPEGNLRIDLIPWCRDSDLSFILKADLAGVPENAVHLSSDDVSRIL